MRLTTTFDLSGWYRQVAASGKPIAWCSAFAPAEALLALGVIPVYPENHAAMLGALSPTRDQDAPYSRAAIAGAVANGYTTPRLCAYALSDLGVLTAGAASPIGALPGPDLFYACDSQCSVVARWGDAVAGHLKKVSGREVPHYVLKAPPLRGATHTEAEVAGFRAQLDQHLADIGQRFHLKMDPARLTEVVRESAEANRLWQACLELGRTRPAPWTSWDAFTAMAPIVVARGFPEATDFYRRLLAELQERVRQGVAAVPGERTRVVWDAIPVWPRKNWLAKRCASHHAAVVASTYTHSWWFDFDHSQAMDSLVRRYAWNTMNRSGEWVLDWTVTMARDFGADRVICHWNRSCGIWNSYVKRRLNGLRDAGLSVYLLEADMVDATAFDETRIAVDLDQFLA